MYVYYTLCDDDDEEGDDLQPPDVGNEVVLVGPGTPASLLAKYLITCSIIMAKIEIEKYIIDSILI